jgi:hypothetical protein
VRPPVRLTLHLSLLEEAQVTTTFGATAVALRLGNRLKAGFVIEDVGTMRCRQDGSAAVQDQRSIELLLPAMISRASCLLRVIVSWRHDDGRRDSTCLASKWEALTCSAAH